ncbi:ogr/Delta-like zinc finger family protein [Sodalis glossinidius]|uniref:ogr/Delta-like zinc finger family protein n=1 Tax=Sodalis glossinidius TaxID=63612 RepID=UPI0011D0E6DE
MAFKCPRCGAVAKTRTSEGMSSETRRSYHQCQNLLCGSTFTTLERMLNTPKSVDLPKDFTLPKTFFSAHITAMTC